MQITLPDYFGEFECVAGDCPDTCCAGWAIMIDDQAMKKYKKIKGPFGNRVKNSIDKQEGAFIRYHERCAFLNEDNLCDLYLEAGPEYLCKTCRNYPRHVEEFDGLREISLSMSCPIVAKMLLSREEPLKLLSFDQDGEEEFEEDFNFLLFTKLSDTREIMFRILQDRTTAIGTRMAMVLSLAHDLQIRIQQDRLFDVDDLLTRYGKEGAAKRFEEMMGTAADDVLHRRLLDDMFSLLDSLEILKSDWPDFLRTVRGGNGNRRLEDIHYEQIMIYFLYTYFCGAVYDRRAYSKVKFAFVSTMLIAEMYMRSDTEMDLCDIAYRYCREVEHSDDNLTDMEEQLRKRYHIEELVKLCKLI